MSQNPPYNYYNNTLQRRKYRLMRGVSINVTASQWETPSCQQSTLVWTHTYTQTIHSCIYASWLGIQKKEREEGRDRAWRLLINDCIHMYIYISPPQLPPIWCLLSQSSVSPRGGRGGVSTDISLLVCLVVSCFFFPLSFVCFYAYVRISSVPRPPPRVAPLSDFLHYR